MSKRKIVLLASALCMVAILAIGGTLAYFTDQETATNTFTMGGVEIDLYEHDEDEKEVEALTYTDVVPGIAYDKDPTVDNDGSLDAWVRVNVTLNNYSIFAAAAKAHNVTDLATIFGGHDYTKWTRANISVNEESDTVTYSYYYNTVLAAGASTGPLFTTVTIPAAFTGDDLKDLTGFKITVTADAIQKDPFTTAADAFAAFADAA